MGYKQIIYITIEQYIIYTRVNDNIDYNLQRI